MNYRYTHSTCLGFGTDGEADYCELDVTVSFEVSWGCEPSGHSGPPEDYDPGSPDVVEAIRVEVVDNVPGASVKPETLAAVIAAFEEGSMDADLIASAMEQE